MVRLALVQFDKDKSYFTTRASVLTLVGPKKGPIKVGFEICEQHVFKGVILRICQIWTSCRRCAGTTKHRDHQ